MDSFQGIKVNARYTPDEWQEWMTHPLTIEFVRLMAQRKIQALLQIMNYTKDSSFALTQSYYMTRGGYDQITDLIQLLDSLGNKE